MVFKKAQKSAPTTPTPAKTDDAVIASKKRGRPARAAKADIDDEPAPKRVATTKSTESDTADAPAKKRGRPTRSISGPTKPVAKLVAKPAAKSTAKSAAPSGRGRGRPPKSAAATTTSKAKQAALAAKKTAAAKKSASAKVVDDGAEAPRKRGRPPKGGETTKITDDDNAAAEQLEEELNETADEPDAVMEADGLKDDEEEAIDEEVAPAAVQDEEAEDEEDEEHQRKTTALTQTRETAARSAKQTSAKQRRTTVDAQSASETVSSGKNYWLMKAEQIDREEMTKSGKMFNTKFTIDDLLEKAGPEAWDGVRNAVAAKNMRSMKQGDLAFFYASGGKSGLKPGIVGIMEIVKEHEPDVTTADDTHYAYVEKEEARARWCVVHVEFRKKFKQPIGLAKLQEYGKDDGPLNGMDLFKYARLSVGRVSQQQWDFILGDLSEGFSLEIDSFENVDGTKNTEVSVIQTD